MEKKYQVFISSTYEDLREERKKVQDTILTMCQFPIGMELFTAGDDEQWEVIKESIDSSDYYVLIIGHRYGSVIDKGEDAGISYTEKEYRYAKSKGIPILAFIIGENVLVLPAHMESDSKKSKKLHAFINEVKTGRIVKWWESKEELAILVMGALNNEIVKGRRPGWIRADSFNIEESQKEIVELLKKNRVLEEENRELKKMVSTRMPELYVDINGVTTLEIPFYEKEVDVEGEYVYLNVEDYSKDILDEVGVEKIEEYNKSLPSREVLEKYKSDLGFYHRVKENAMQANFKVHNDGSLKARDIHIELVFPEEIKVLNKKNRDKLSEPVKPEILTNPIEEYYAKGINIGKILQGYDMFMQSPVLGKSPLGLSSYMNFTGTYETKHFLNKDNSVSIRLDDLINNYTWSIKDEYFIVPLKKGTFEIECSIMCEEYSETKKQLIQVNVR